MRFRSIIERVVTKNDYFHQPHLANHSFCDPGVSYYYDLRNRYNFSGPFKGNLPLTIYQTHRFANPIHAAQFGLAHLLLYWDTLDETYLLRAKIIAHELVREGRFENKSLVWRYPLTVSHQVNWLSAMAQGQVVSFIARVGYLVQDDFLLEAARAALEPFNYDVSRNGVTTMLTGHVWYEEYATDPIPYTLNGFIVALFGLRDASILLESSAIKSKYELGVETLLHTVKFFHYDDWTLYDLSETKLYRKKIKNTSSPFYHRFHIELMKIMGEVANEKLFKYYADQWSQGLDKGLIYYKAVFEKMIYRSIVANKNIPSN